MSNSTFSQNNTQNNTQSNSQKNIFLSITAVLLALFLIWMGASLYLISTSTSLIYQTDKSKNLSYQSKTRSVFLNLKDGTKVEVLIAEAKDKAKKDNVFVYFHGNWGRIPKNIDELTEYGTVVSPAYPGYSKSEGKPNTALVYETAEVTMQWLETQKIDPAKTTIFGHSLGGSAAIYAATKYPDAKKLILVNTFYSIQSECQRSYSILCVLAYNVHNSANISQGINPSMPLYQFHNPKDDQIPQTEGKKLHEQMPNSQKSFSNIEGTHGDFDAIWVIKQAQK